MRKYMLAMVLFGVFLAIFVPLASTSPDGLEKVAETLGIVEHEPFWGGLMFDYSIEAIGNSYVSALVAGILGTAAVLVVGLALGRVLAKKSSHALEKRV